MSWMQTFISMLASTFCVDSSWHQHFVLIQVSSDHEINGQNKVRDYESHIGIKEFSQEPQ
jgi:hypothetical protein